MRQRERAALPVVRGLRSRAAAAGADGALRRFGFVAVVRFFLPLLPPPVLGAGMAFGAGGIVYLAAVSWAAVVPLRAPTLKLNVVVAPSGPGSGWKSDVARAKVCPPTWIWSLSL